MSSQPNAPVLESYVYIQLAKTCKLSSLKKGSEELTRKKECCFCGRLIKLSDGKCEDSWLRQHMLLSVDCQTIQAKLSESGSLASMLPSSIATAKNSIPNPLANPSISSENPLSDHMEATPTEPHFTICPGALVEYEVPVFSNYPMHLHEANSQLDYEFSHIDPLGKSFRIRSRKCSRRSSRGGNAACDACNRVVIGQQFQDIIRRADPNNPTPSTLNLRFRTYAQLCDLLKETTSQLNELKLKHLSLQRRMKSMSSCVDDQKRLMLAISQSDDAAVGRIVQTALRHGAGVNTIINRIVQAQQGLFHPRKYSQKMFDLAVLVHKVGGPRLLFAVGEAMHLPGLSTIHSRLTLPQLWPSICFPLKDEIMRNIKSFFGSLKMNILRAGFSLMINEIAIEPRLRYSIQQDTIVGLCREHALKANLSNLSSGNDTLDLLLHLQARLNCGDCHRAVEATMVALARFGVSDYNPALILASGTCKTETASDQARWIELVLQSWIESPFGEMLHGAIWSICTDGDAKRRLALFQLCMMHELPKSSELFRLIGHLPLLNLQCSPTLVTHDGDYKHEEKRLASAMHSRSGILVNGAHITPKMLVKYLRCLDDLPESRILSFFDGTDPQNVPKANSLLMHLSMAAQHPSIVSRPENKPFVLLGEALGSFVSPFTIPTMSLSEQITSLSKCGHLLFSLYRIDGTQFLPGQLIYDIQASIKNVIFCVGKTQLIDPSLPFYLLQTGTDRLESRFGTYQTVTSDRNGDLLQMCERAASAQHIDQIFAEYPSWNRTPYRLSLDGKSGIDHTNPSSWTGNVVVKNVNLYECWTRGQNQAADRLKWAGVPFEFDSSILSATSPNIDLMRPFGMYPGVQVDNIEPISTPVSPSELSDNLDFSAEVNSNLSNDFGSPVDIPSARLGDDELGIENLLPPIPQEPDQPTSIKKGWILLENKPVHLESAVRCLLGSDSGAKSTDRLRRVRGYTRYLQSSGSPTDSIIGNDFHVSDLAASLLLSENKVAIVIIRVTNIVANDGRLLESISEDHFSDPGITLSGQVLELKHEPECGIWYWTKEYDLITAANTSAHRKRGTGFDLIARLCSPINPELIEQDDEFVWAFKHNQLHQLMGELWDICTTNKLETYIPVCGASCSFPYQTDDGSTALFHSEATRSIQHSLPPIQGECPFCNERVDIKQKMRVHIGRHLLALRSGHDKANLNMKNIAKICGFCGKEGPCRSWVERQAQSKQSLRIASHCRYKDSLSYRVAVSSSKSNPCTNRPVQCPCCPLESYIWSYCLRDHLLISHGVEALQATKKQIEGFDPSDEEYSNMGVDPQSGLIITKATRRRKRQQENGLLPAEGNEASSRKKRCT